MIFDSLASESIEINDIDLASHEIILAQPLSNSYYAGYSQNGRGAAIAVVDNDPTREDDVYTVDSSLLPNAYGLDSSGRDGGFS